ncbi:ankyrin repeat domain-containing protein [Rhodocytophaga rosea]|uniref:Ankyrin repeat domain-containing protein n=1 Tax=Rhodocytophaga rosea TaxID=2704465 RepID=A0A6C0GBA7_9BACT|nr:ankyrin repeat domain-containing protein [Rhodocytophaga rosea]QHT65216.1 ankyrin repeat domain-containing protein [Rhodocytophaga rosea]
MLVIHSSVQGKLVNHTSLPTDQFSWQGECECSGRNPVDLNVFRSSYKTCGSKAFVRVINADGTYALPGATFFSALFNKKVTWNTYLYEKEHILASHIFETSKNNTLPPVHVYEQIICLSVSGEDKAFFQLLSQTLPRKIELEAEVGSKQHFSLQQVLQQGTITFSRLETSFAYPDTAYTHIQITCTQRNSGLFLSSLLDTTVSYQTGNILNLELPRDEFIKELLRIAVHYRLMECIKMLLSQPGYQALVTADIWEEVCKGNTSIADENESEKIASLLIESGVNPTLKNRHNYTLLHEAVEHNSLAIVRLALNHQSEINTPAGQETPLYKAVENMSLPMVQLLVEHGAFLEKGYVPDYAYELPISPLYKAVENIAYSTSVQEQEKLLSIIQYLVTKGADVQAKPSPEAKGMPEVIKEGFSYQLAPSQSQLQKSLEYLLQP